MTSVSLGICNHQTSIEHLDRTLMEHILNKQKTKLNSDSVITRLQIIEKPKN